MKRKKIVLSLVIYGLAHLLVDCMCAAIVFRIRSNKVPEVSSFVYLTILYNVLAFGLQPIVGFVVDYFRLPKLASVLGLIFVVISTCFFIDFPLVAIIIAGIGNAFFHIGGGIVALNLIPKKAIAVGVFVAPGAIGLLIGSQIGKSLNFEIWPFVVISFVLSILIFLAEKPKIDYKLKLQRESEQKNFNILLLLVLITITIRSFVGSLVVFPWNISVLSSVGLAVSVAFGKAAGGIIGDKFGWRKISIGTLILSIPLLVLGMRVPLFGMFGIFLFNFTMPITLVLISNIIPGRPGFAFGLNCFALLLGFILAIVGRRQFQGDMLYLSLVVLLSSFVLYYGFSFYSKISN
ncbi:MAG TPA: hypothetical protein PLK49_00830 [Candidatus Dojkabacteria bacterium]|jgi:FSR family fosmidomycin resistance protein-like MFS transporter|nr:hypothetical protein [Candidatus Dojkabacteria bacterium]HQB85356.1 hypothetical protein [Candidatus Pacearchaeota archaeon]HQM95355.1 hypothetical protein [Methanofastidiosum sp.]